MSAEYVDDVPYVRQFVPDLSPTRLRVAAALNGVAPPPTAEFDYCELGCAHGDTLVALAAAHPEGRFLGVDLIESHVASGNRLVREGALENVGIVARDFAALVTEDIGPFDYIAAHGVLSWVSPEKRKALFDLARAKLKPGGLLHVSYNAMPGWASVEPLRQLLLFGGVGREGDTSLARAQRGFELAAAMNNAGSAYFAKNPSATEMLETMAKAGLPYVVHEYLHEHWVPMYFARVAWETAAADLHFVGTLPMHANFRDTGLSEALERLLAPVTDRVTFESLRDYAVNAFFRRDLYVKGAAVRSSAVTVAHLDSTAWGTLANPGQAARTVPLPHRTATFEGPTFDAIFAALAEGPATVHALAARADLAEVGVDGVRAAMVRLIVAEQVLPMRAAPPAPPGAHDRYVVPLGYNRAMLRRLSPDAPILLASTRAGTALPMTPLEALALRVLTEVEAPDRARWVDDLVRRNVVRLRIGDRTIEDHAEQRRAILDTVDALRAQRVSKLVELGILEPAPRPA